MDSHGVTTKRSSALDGAVSHARLQELRSRLATVQAAAWAVIGAGVLFRVLRYADNRSLWLDEAWLAISITEKPWGNLLRPLDFLQAAPLGFLMAEKAVTSVLGETEHALRLVPFLASLSSLFLFRYVADYFLSPRASLLATVLFSFNSILLYQAAEAKPYSSDLALGLLVLALGIRVARGGISIRSLVPLAVIAPAAIWLSFPVIIVLGGVFGGLTFQALRSRNRRGMTGLVILGATWVFMFGAVLAATSANVASTRISIFGGDEAAELRRPAEVTQSLWASFVNPAGFGNGTNGLAVLLFIVGFLVLAYRGRVEHLLLLGLPTTLAVVAALLGRYPLGGRFSVFLVPFLLIPLALGASEVVSAAARARTVASLLLVTFLAGPFAVGAVAGAVSPPTRDEARPLLRELVRGWRKGDSLYVSRNAQYPLRFYAGCGACDPPSSAYDFPVRPTARAPEQFARALESVPPEVVVGPRTDSPKVIVASAAPLFPRPRVWLLFVHADTTDEVFEQRLITAEFSSRGTLTEIRRESGASLYLYRAREP